MSQIFSCLYDDHDAEAIVGYCLNLQCELPPQCCVQCIQTKHIKHQDDCKTFRNVNNMIQNFICERKGQEKKFTMLLSKVKEQIEKIIKGSKQDQEYLCHLDQMLKESKHYELKQNIKFLKSHYTSGKEKKDKDKTQLLSKFSMLCEEQKSILSQLDQGIFNQYYSQGQLFNNIIGLSLKQNQLKQYIYQQPKNGKNPFNILIQHWRLILKIVRQQVLKLKHYKKVYHLENIQIKKILRGFTKCRLWAKYQSKSLKFKL